MSLIKVKSRGTDNVSGRRNLLMNGSMQVAQRATSATGVGASSGYFTCDRWEIETGNSAGRLTMAQNSDSPDGFNNSISLSCTTADTSIASNEYFRLQQVIEAQNLQSLAKGTSSAKQFTLSFYVKGNATATYGIEIYDLDNTRHICSTFNVTTSWNRVSITFAGDTTGAINDDNGGGFQVGIYLHAGSDYNSGTLATSWASNTTANRTSSSNTSFYDSTSRTFFITGVQLEVGDSASDFEHRSFGEELALCKRYFQKVRQGIMGMCTNSSNGGCNWWYEFPVQMRATPSVSCSTTAYRYGDMIAIGIEMTSISVSAGGYRSEKTAMWSVSGTKGSGTPVQYRTQLLEPQSASHGDFLFGSEL